MAEIILINGSFGVGKTTTAELLKGQLPGSRIYDPELVGSVLRRLPTWVPIGPSRTDDFQDLQLWRMLTQVGISLAARLVRSHLIVPMTLSRDDYFEEILHGLRRRGFTVVVFCLQASLETIRARLVARGTPIHGPGSEWIVRRTDECVRALVDDRFGQRVDAQGRSAQAVADEIAAQLFRCKADRGFKVVG